MATIWHSSASKSHPFISPPLNMALFATQPPITRWRQLIRTAEPAAEMALVGETEVGGDAHRRLSGGEPVAGAGQF